MAYKKVSLKIALEINGLKIITTSTLVVTISFIMDKSTTTVHHMGKVYWNRMILR